MKTLFSLMVLLTVIWQHGEATDRITITKVEARHTSKGTSPAADWFLNFLKELPAQVLGMGIAGIASPVIANVAQPLTVKAAQHSANAINKLVETTGGGGTPDDFFMVVNGIRWAPKGENSQKVSPGTAIYPNFKVDFNGEARITLWEYDWGSGDDNLGTLTVNTAAFPAGNFAQDDVIVVSKEHESVYLVSYKVERNVQGAQWLLCGTGKCKPCAEARCRAESISGLDRDKDKPDLKRCPSTHNHHDYRKYPQSWPFADVYLRICQPK